MLEVKKSRQPGAKGRLLRAKANQQPSKAAGFTIIETLIVLAIAGIILLIVFEALPAVQRSGRNNQRKQDVQSILGTVSHYELAHSGNLPSNAQLCSDLQQYTKLTYYDDSSCASSAVQLTPFTYGVGVITRPPVSAITNLDKVDLYNYAKCDSNGDGGANGDGAGYNDIVALYAIESSSNSAGSQCQQI